MGIEGVTQKEEKGHKSQNLHNVGGLWPSDVRTKGFDAVGALEPASSSRDKMQPNSISNFFYVNYLITQRENCGYDLLLVLLLCR